MNRGREFRMSGRHADATAADGVDGNGVIGASVDRDSAATTTLGRTTDTAATTELSRTTDDAATAEVDLGADPFDDNLATELAARVEPTARVPVHTHPGGPGPGGRRFPRRCSGPEVSGR